MEPVCDFDPNLATHREFKECLEQMDPEKLSKILESLKNEIPLLPRLGEAGALPSGLERILLGISATPSGRFLNFSTVEMALTEIATFSKAHNQPAVVRENLPTIYESIPDGPTILYDFLVVCPMYELARFLQEERRLRVHFYVFVLSNSTRVPPSMTADQFMSIFETENFEIKRVQVNFQSVLGAFIHDSSSWPEWKPNGAHLLFNGTERVVLGFREHVCDQWKLFFKYSGIDALR